MKTKQYTALFPFTGEIIGKVTARSRSEGYELMYRILRDDALAVFLADGPLSVRAARILNQKG